MSGPPGIGPARIPSSAPDARLLLRQTDLDAEAGNLLRVCRKLRRRLERSLETLVPLVVDQDPLAKVPPPPLAWSAGFEALSVTMRALLQHQRDGQKIQLAAIKLAQKAVDDELTEEEEAEELEMLARERIDAMSADELERALERKRKELAGELTVEV